jgi:hypothetical protein
MKFKRNSEVLFLDPLQDEKIEYDKSKKLSIILSPSLYWVKKLSLPVKYIRDVKKLLPSIFEDTLPEGHYSYSAYKSGDEFFVFAYEDRKILDLLNKKGINAADVQSLHFAQSELGRLEYGAIINKTQALVVKDELLVIVPSSWLSEKKGLDLSKTKPSKHTIKLQQYGHIVDNSSLYKIGAMLMALILILGVEILIAEQKKDAILQAKDELFSKYKLQATTLQNRSTLNKYKKIHNIQTKLREYISYFLKIRLKSNQKLTLLEFKDKTLHASISGVKKSDEKTILSKFISEKVKYKISYIGDSMRVEIKL